MSDLVRFSVSLEKELLDEFDRHCESGRYATRSDGIRQLLREQFTANAWDANATDVSASLTLVYDHHKTKLTDQLLEVQHRHGENVVSSMHVHLNHDLCMEVIVLRGAAKALQQLADELSGLKGIHQAQLVIARAVGTEPTQHHPHRHVHTQGHKH
jgi:CopG family transcriptional regulator, nickel-responsive regulator